MPLERYGPAGCEVGSAIRFGREGVRFEHDLPLHWWIHHLEFIADGADATNSMVMRSSIPWNTVVPPDSPTLAHGVLEDVHVTLHGALERKSHGFRWLLYQMKLAKTNTSAQRKRSEPTAMMFPSGSS